MSYAVLETTRCVSGLSDHVDSDAQETIGAEMGSAKARELIVSQSEGKMSE